MESCRSQILIVRFNCKKCYKYFSGEANRIKQHIPFLGGNVKDCKEASTEDMTICMNALHVPHKKETQEEEYKTRQEVWISEERVKKTELAAIGSKKPHVFGPLDKMVNGGKLKQIVNNEGDKRKWKELAFHYKSL